MNGADGFATFLIIMTIVATVFGGLGWYSRRQAA